MTQWTDELRKKAIDMYKEAEPTAENSAEIVKEIAEDLDVSPNGVRSILTKEGVYIKKAATTKSSSTASGDKPARVSKEDAHNRLVAAIEAAGQTADTDLISKLTGKAAVHFAEVIEAITN